MNGRIGTTEAAERLGVKRETIYAYVSRGLLDSRRAVDGKTSTFDPGQVERLRRRRVARRPGRLEVPLASAVTEVTDGHVAYRGHTLAELVGAGAGYESVAELLWTGRLDPAGPWKVSGRVAATVRRATRVLPEHATPTDAMMAAVVAAGAADPFREDLSVTGVTGTGRQLIGAIVDSLPLSIGPAGSQTGDPGLAARLWIRLTPEHPGAWPLLDAALTLLADHGLATSTLAARVAASTRAGPHAVLLAALGAVAGPLHGGAGRLVHRLLTDAGQRGADAAIGAALHDGDRLPGVGHLIHRRGDPRHELLMERLVESRLDARRLDVAHRVIGRIAERGAAPANVDLALGTLTYAAGMDEHAGEVIFAIARSAGWLAHALEEYDAPALRFRPVGRYVGTRPA